MGTCSLFFFFLGNGSNQQAVSDSQRAYVSKPPPMISNSLDSAVADHDPEPGVKSQGSVQLEIPSAEQKKEKAISAVFSAINGRPLSNGISEEDPDTLINILLDKDLPLSDRRNAAWILAKLGNTDILIQLENILLQQDSPPYLNDEISEIRAETAWTLAYVDDPGDVADSLERRLAVEEDTEVRKRLHQALGNQESVDISAHAEVILQEPNH